MKKLSLAIILMGSLSLIGCKDDKRANDDLDGETEVMTTTDDATVTIGEETERQRGEEGKRITVTMEPKSGSNLSGTVVFIQEASGVRMDASIAGLSEGKHAMHLHETGDCSTADASSAGGHWNPTFERHGEWGDSEGFHRGDIGNFNTNENGVAEFTFSTDKWCIGCDDEKMNILGKSVIVHDGVDDFTSQPSGDAGKRVGCGVIKNN